MDEHENVARLRLSASRAQEIIQERALDADNIVWSVHALERMDERGIYDIDVLRILRKGFVDDDPEQTDLGEWKCKVTLNIKRGRTAGVVTIIMSRGELYVKTVEWEDSI